MTSKRTIVHIVLFVLSLGLIVGLQWFYASSPSGERVSRNLWGLNLLHYSKLVAEIPDEERATYSLTAADTGDGDGPPVPVLTPGTGLYDSSVSVSVGNVPARASVHYTTDGSVPRPNDPHFPAALTVDATTTLRIKSFASDGTPGRTVTATYFVDYEGEVAVASLTLDPVYLFNPRSGIYANPFQRGRAWERPAEFAMVSPESGAVLQAELRIRIHGDSSRGVPIKSFRLYVSPEQADLRSWFGEDAEVVSSDQGEWVLRHANNFVVHRDRIGTAVAAQMGLPVSPVLPVVLYLNGRPWGVYDLMERVNPQFVEGKFPVEKLTLLRGSFAEPGRVVGKRKAWKNFYAWVESSDLTVPANYERVARTMDLDNLIDYSILHIFIADNDGPDSNVDLFRQSDTSPWKLLIWDLDAGFNYRGTFTEHDTLAWNLRDTVRPELKPYGTPDAPWQVRSTALLRKLMENPTFRNRFTRRFDELLSSTLSTENLRATVDDVLRRYRSVARYEYGRYPEASQHAAAERLADVESRIEDFVERRPSVMRELLARRF